MKKITLIAAAAAMAALPALAIGPRQQQVAMQPKKMTPATIAKVNSMAGKRAVLTTGDMRRLSGYKAAEETPTVPDDVVDILPGNAIYAPSYNAFYLGMSPAWATYGATCGFTGIRNAIGFMNLTSDADSFSWLWREPVGVSDDNKVIYKDHTSTDAVLRVDLKPDLFFAAPTLSAVFDGDTVSYQPEGVAGYYCGGSSFDWGYTTAPDGTTKDEANISDVLGAGVAAMPIDDGTWFPYNSFMLPSAGIPNLSNQYDALGTYSGWKEYFATATGYDYTNAEVKAFTTIVPGMPSPYQLGSVWMMFLADLTADMTLTATVYPITDNGIEYEHPIAKGETIVAKDWNPETDDLPVVFFEALDEDGYETQMFPCIPTNTPLAVAVSGFSKDNTKYFIPMMYEGSVLPVEMEEIAEDIYPIHASVQISVDETPKGGTEADKVNRTIDFTCPAAYYTSNALDSLSYASDYMMFFDVEFPTIINIDGSSADNGTANFNTHFEKAGGTNIVKVFCEYDISALLKLEDMTAYVSDQWLTFETKLVEPASEDDLPYTEVSITATALPEGSEGRSGYVLFTGVACDFIVRVTQGTVAGIDEISVTPVAKGTRFFDLQGRRLNAAPASGIYIEQTGSKAVKRVVR